MLFEAVSAPGRPRGQQMLTLAASAIAHATALAVLFVLPLLYFTDQLPNPPDMMAFVVDAPAPPPPPPPPPPPGAPQRRESVKPQVKQVVPPVAAAPVPVEAPETIAPEPLPSVPVQQFGGVEGGVAGGIAGGVLGGVAMMPSPPPPPPPPPSPPAQPVRVGGDIEAPTLVHRVDPEYPSIAVGGKIEGMVILEATVDERGAVEDVRVLRSHPLLDRAAVDAVKQWRYKPLQLNGQATPFILTVTVSFNL
jgi:protein TonB